MAEPPVRDLVVLHLEGYGRFRDDSPVPAAVSPPGIRAAVGGERAGVAERVALLTALDDLESAGLVTGEVRTVEGGHRRNVYFLTNDGLWVTDPPDEPFAPHVRFPDDVVVRRSTLSVRGTLAKRDGSGRI